MRETLGTYNAFNAQPFVGYVSSGESVEIERDGVDIVCRQSKSATLLMGFIAGMILLCVGFALTSPDMERHIRNFQHADLWGKLIMGFLALLILWMTGATVVFSLKKLFSNTRIVVDAHGKLNFYAGMEKTPQRVVRPEQIETLYLTTVTFNGKHQTHTVTLLVLRLKTGEETVLCAGVNQTPLAQFRRDISGRCGIRFQEAVAH